MKKNISKKDDFLNNKTLWGLLVGSAQCDMKWTYTMEEVKESIKQKKESIKQKKDEK